MRSWTEVIEPGLTRPSGGAWRVAICCVVALFIMLGRASASPLDKALVDPAALWSAHIDADLVRTSAVINIDSLAAVLAKSVRAVEADTGLSLLHNVHGLTFYSMPGAVDMAVVVITTTDAADDLHLNIRLAQPLSHRRGRTALGVEFSQWRHGNLRFFAAVHAGRVPGQRLVVIAERKAVLETGSARIVGAGVTHSPAPRPIDSPGAGSMVYVTFGDMRNSPGFQPRARMLTLVSAASLDIMLAGDNLLTRIKIWTDSPRDADRVAGLLNGALTYVQAGRIEFPKSLASRLAGDVKVTNTEHFVSVEGDHSKVVVDQVAHLYVLRAARTRGEHSPK
jgi:hypothetical protein